MTRIELTLPDGQKTRPSVPEKLRPKRFKDFVQKILTHYRKDEDITIKEAVRICGVCEKTASKYLEAMKTYPFLHLKGPASQLKNIYHLGCTPLEELIFDAKKDESSAGAAAFELVQWFTGIFRPLHILASPKGSMEEKLTAINQWYQQDYWRPIHAIIGAGIPLLTVLGAITINEAQQNLGSHF